MSRVIAVLLAVSVMSCGLTMAKGPEGTPPGQRPLCSETMSAPKKDAYPAVLGFVTFLVGLLFYKTDDDNEDLGAAMMVGGAVVTVASYVSGGIGYFRVKRCQKAVADWQTQQGVMTPPPPP